MDNLKLNAIKIHLEDFPTYEQMEEDLLLLLEEIDTYFINTGYWGKGESNVGEFTKKYETYKNAMVLLNGLDKNLQQKVDGRVEQYVLTFVDLSAMALNYWEPEELSKILIPALLDDTEIKDPTKVLNVWGVREAYLRSQDVLTQELQVEFLDEFCEVVCEEVLVYTVEYMVNKALQTGDLDIELLLAHGLGINTERFKQLFYASSKEFDNMDDLSQYLIAQKDSYTQINNV